MNVPLSTPRNNAEKVLTNAISGPITPQVMMNKDGFINGDATRNAINGATGTPTAISPPTSGIAANVDIGEITPTTAANKIGMLPFRVRNTCTLSLDKNWAISTAANAPRSPKYQSSFVKAHVLERIFAVYVPLKKFSRKKYMS